LEGSVGGKTHHAPGEAGGAVSLPGTNIFMEPRHSHSREIEGRAARSYAERQMCAMPSRKEKSSPSSKPLTPTSCLIYGPDNFRNAETARTMIHTLCPPEEQIFGVEQVDGRADTKDAAVAALRNCLLAIRTGGFLGGKKVVWFRDATFLKNDRLLKSAEVRHWMDELTDLVRHGLPEGHFLILTAPAVDGRGALYRAFKSSGRIVEQRLPEKPRESTAEAAAMAQAYFEKAGVRADAAAVRELAERVGPDAAALAQETAKLAAWAGGQIVTVEDVRRLTPATRERVAWTLADALGPGRAAEALRALRQLLDQSESAIALAAGLESRFRDLMILHECKDRGWVRLNGPLAAWSERPEAEALLSALGDHDPRRLHPYRAGRLLEESLRYSPDRLRSIRGAILDARERMVSGFARGDLLLEWLVMRICDEEHRGPGASRDHDR